VKYLVQVVDIAGDDGKMRREMLNVAEVFDMAALVVVCCQIGMGNAEITKSQSREQVVVR
jgi:hypothetical protein